MQLTLLFMDTPELRYKQSSIDPENVTASITPADPICSLIQVKLTFRALDMEQNFSISLFLRMMDKHGDSNSAPTTTTNMTTAPIATPMATRTLQSFDEITASHELTVEQYDLLRAILTPTLVQSTFFKSSALSHRQQLIRVLSALDSLQSRYYTLYMQQRVQSPLPQITALDLLDSELLQLQLNRVTPGLDHFELAAQFLSVSPRLVQSTLYSRQLHDEYSGALLTTDRLLNLHYGRQSRSAISHMPFLLNREILYELEHRWPSLWNSTASHRFRSTSDFQYAFLYYYYLQLQSAPLHWSDFAVQIDTNGDGYFTADEFHALARFLHGKTASDIELNDLLTGLQRCSPITESPIRTPVEKNFWNRTLNFDTLTVPQVLQCPHIVSTLHTVLSSSTSTTTTSMLRPKFQTRRGVHTDVEFFPMPSNVSVAKRRLEAIELKRPKFVCINDDMKDADNDEETAETQRLLAEFYQRVFPRPSPFENQIQQPLLETLRRRTHGITWWWWGVAVGLASFAWMKWRRLEQQRLLRYKKTDERSTLCPPSL